MSFTLDCSLALGLSRSGLTDLRAQLVDTTGSAVGSAVSTGFVEIGVSGNYLWHYAAWPDAHRGGVKFYSNAAPTVFLAFVAINPEEAENTDSKISLVAAAVWAAGTRTLTGFGTLVADIWANATRTITGGTVTTNSDKTGYALSGAGVQAIWDALTSALTTVGSIGKLIVDNLNATITSRMATFVYTAPDNATIATRASQASVDALNDLSTADIDARLAAYDGATYTDLTTAQTAITDAITGLTVPDNASIAAIKAKTDNLPSDPADASVVAGLIAAVQADTDDLQVQIGAAGAGLTALGDTRIATLITNVAAILAQTGTGGVVLSTATLQAIADALLKRGASHVDGATPDENSMYELIEAVLQSSTATGAWRIYATDGTTLFNQRTLTTDAGALPVVGAS